MKQIAALRLKAGLTQYELAKRLDVTSMAVSHWESGRREPPLSMLRKIAAVLGVRVCELIEDEPISGP